MIKTIAMLALALALSACANNSAKEDADDAEDVADLASLFGEPKKIDEKELDKFHLGSEKNPVRVNGPRGQRYYLSRLVCENHEPVSAFERLGSAGESPFGTIMDIYEVICDTNKGVVKHEIFMDMYHPNHVETRPAAGFLELKPAN